MGLFKKINHMLDVGMREACSHATLLRKEGLMDDPSWRQVVLKFKLKRDPKNQGKKNK